MASYNLMYIVHIVYKKYKVFIAYFIFYNGFNKFQILFGQKAWQRQKRRKK